MAKIQSFLPPVGIVTHNNLLGLNDGDYIHLTADEKLQFDSFQTQIDNTVDDSIVDGVIDIAPSQNAVYDALILKEDKVNKQNNLNVDGTGTKYPTIDVINTLNATLLHNFGNESKLGALTVNSINDIAITGNSTNNIGVFANSSSTILPGLVAKNSSIGDIARFLNNSNTVVAKVGQLGDITSTSFVKQGGTSLQFLKADGSVDNTLYQDSADKGQPDGYAELDITGRVPISQLPESIIEYKGTYNALTNTPTLTNGLGNIGDTYKVTVAGLGINSLNFVIGDRVVYNGSTWEKEHTGEDKVTSVFSRQGAIIAQTGDYTTALVTEVANKNYQTDNQKLYNDATSSIQTQLDARELLANKQNDLSIYDGTGVKYVGKDGFDNWARNVAKVATKTGLLSKLDTFNLTALDNFTVRIAAVESAVFWNELFVPATSPAFAIKSFIQKDYLLTQLITATGGNVNVTPLTTDGKYVRYLGYDKNGNVYSSSTSFASNNDILQLGFVTVLKTGSSVVFLDGAAGPRNVLAQPNLASNTDFDKVTPTTTTVTAGRKSDASISTSTGTITGISVNWKSAQNPSNGNPIDVFNYTGQATAAFIAIDPTFLNSTSALVTHTLFTELDGGIPINESFYNTTTGLRGTMANGSSAVARIMIGNRGGIFWQMGEFSSTACYPDLATAKSNIYSHVFSDAIIPPGVAYEIGRVAYTKGFTITNNDTQFYLAHTSGGGGGGGGSTPPVSDATVATKGIIKLAGDFNNTSTADLPIIGTLSKATPVTTTSDMIINGVRVGKGPNNIAGNTGTGLNVLNSITTGGNNTADGESALGNITTGGLNIGVGAGAGRFIADGATANQTAVSGTYLGTNTRASANGLSNEIVIGAGAIGNGSNSVTLGSTAITKTYLQGDTLMNTVTQINTNDVLTIKQKNQNGGLALVDSAATGTFRFMFGTSNRGKIEYPGAGLDIFPASGTTGSIITTSARTQTYNSTNPLTGAVYIWQNAGTNLMELHTDGAIVSKKSVIDNQENVSILVSTTANVAQRVKSTYTAAFFDYVATSGTNARSGTVNIVWNGTNFQTSETSTGDIGDTTPLTLAASVDGTNVYLKATSTLGTWSVKTMIRLI